MLGTQARDFSDLIEVGERIDTSIRRGRLENTPSEAKEAQVGKKKEGDINYVQGPYQQPFNRARNPSYSQPNNFARFDSTRPRAEFYHTSLNAQFNHQMDNQHHIRARPVRPPRDERPLPNFNVTRTELYKDLVAKNLMGPQPIKPLQPPFPAWYDPNATCEYHMGVAGHSIDKCNAFRRHVLLLLDNNHIGIKTCNNPNITTNPPEHEKGKPVAMIDNDISLSKAVEDIPCTMKQLYEHLRELGYIQQSFGSNERTSRAIKNTRNVCALDEKVTYFVINKESQAIEGENSSFPTNKLIYEVKESAEKSFLLIGKTSHNVSNKKPIALLHIPASFPYHSNHAVPWNYGLRIEGLHDQGTLNKASNVDITVGGITRSGRIYTDETYTLGGKGLEVGESSGTKEFTVKGKKGGIDEFLKIMKQSEYNIVEQLNKTPARISILSLIFSSEVHRKALQKVLNEAYVWPNITPKKVVNLANTVKNSTLIAFFEDEIFLTASQCPKVLHITLKCHGYVIAKVLIDGDSTLNVLPRSTIELLPVDASCMKHSDVVVKAFDGTRREVIGNVCLPLQIGPSTFVVEFQVMYIDATYTMLLGRPWIHDAEAVPSTLH
ncbi:uncharacterized protein LOC129310792 [Prosopis cineraria]|uniref:uncharacterized protein LOC129310792 n=1 Tax=Prosopis cineraria TaxID=364024 RepID=UPI00240F1CB0|nr:uncharacterized protein LOC129310792 [Prosopis cineraria]